MLVRAAAVAALLVAPAVALAQSSGGGLAMSGTCSGAMMGTIGLAVPQGNNNFLTIPSSQIMTGVYGIAECQCAEAPNNPDINVEIKLTTALPTSMASGSAELWVGDSSCQNPTTRTSSSNQNCEKLSTIPINVNDFTINSTGTSTSGLHYDVKADALTQPFKHMCDPTVAGGPQPTAANGVYIFLFTDVNNPYASCYLALNEDLQQPAGVSNVAAGSGDSAISLTWTLPPTSNISPQYLQVLCADDCGNPITSSPPTQFYSVCSGGVLSRKNLTMGGGGSTGVDGGAGGSGGTDMGPSRITPGGGNEPEFVVHPPEGQQTTCDTDMGNSAASLAALAALDPRYICTASLTPTSTMTRISGLTNFQKYHFVVLSIDAYGNATPSAVVDGMPQPTEDLWRRYRDEGGGAGGCFIATAAFGSYENRWVWVLRDFRDRVLLLHDSGKSFVEWYYANSPPAAAWIAGHGWARTLTRIALAPLIAGAWFWLYVPAAQKALILTLLIGFFFRRRILAAVRRTTT